MARQGYTVSVLNPNVYQCQSIFRLAMIEKVLAWISLRNSHGTQTLFKEANQYSVQQLLKKFYDGFVYNKSCVMVQV